MALPIFTCNGVLCEKEASLPQPRWRELAQIVGLDYKGDIEGNPDSDPRAVKLRSAVRDRVLSGIHDRIPCGQSLDSTVEALPKDGMDHKVTCSACGTIATIHRLKVS